MREEKAGRFRDTADRKIFSKAWEGNSWRIIVTVSSYKGLPPKLLITREKSGRKYENRPFAKLGRLSKEEVAGLIPMMQEAMLHMK
ncbi:MAG: hypothetical protein PHN49_11850 [Candidatus Omnitrophica bacterium]|nr:hypothetical protein [Candidatus Omnitrophota bacterium]MDD5672320.1 hypothetical protein [Candidatus Omnitrophota bacterium]